MSYTEEFRIVAATVYGEAASQSVASQKAIANCIMNRIRYREWKNFETAAAVVEKSGFDAYKQQTLLYKQAYAEMAAGEIKTPTLRALVDAIQPIVDGADTGGCGNIVLYYSPGAQSALHKRHPKKYAEQPKWNFDALEQVQIPGTENDDFRWYRYSGTASRLRVVDQIQQPVKNLEYKVIDKYKKLLAYGTTDAKGQHRFNITEHVKHGDLVTLYVKNIRKEWQELRDFPFDSNAFTISLTSPKAKYSVTLKKKSEGEGAYIRGTYTVKKGDTLSSIAKRFHTTVDWLASRNKIHDVNNIKTGRALIVPPVQHRKTGHSAEASAAHINVGGDDSGASVSASKASSTKSKPANNSVSKPTDAEVANSSASSSPDRTDVSNSNPSSGAAADAGNQVSPNNGKPGSVKGANAPVTITSPKPIPKPVIIADYSKNNGNPQTLVQGARCDNQSGCLKKGDRGKLIEEINIRLTGFGGAIPSDEFNSLTEAAVKQFQKDYMGVPPTGRVCGNTVLALDKFRAYSREAIDAVFGKIACRCKKCSGFGNGAHHDDPYPRSLISDREEYPGIHRSLIWMMKSMHFYLQKERELGYSFDRISSGYRCHEDNKIHKRETTNHMGKALDLLFSKGGERVVRSQGIQEIRDKIFIKHLGARMGWNNLNQMGMESAGQGAKSWVHVDVRQFEQKYKDHRFFVQSSVAAHGDALFDIAKREGRILLCSCIGNSQ